MDIDYLWEWAHRLGAKVRGLRERLEAQKIRQDLGKEPRIKIVKGFRGSGKTTLLLHLFLNDEKSFYLSADHIFFKRYDLYSTVESIIKRGYSRILIDEIHTYPAWRRIIKSLYEAYDVDFVLSGSAPVIFTPERREKIYEISFLPFSHFLYLAEGVILRGGDAWKNKNEAIKFVAEHPIIEKYWEKYMSSGLPLFFTYRDETPNALLNAVEKSVREDAAFYLKMSGEKIQGMEKILTFLATSPPGELSINALCNILGLGKYTVYELLHWLEAMEIIRIVKPFGRGGKLIRASPKMLFYHPALRIAICNALGEKADVGALREEIAIFSLKKRGYEVRTVKGMRRSPDYVITKGNEQMVIEIGGESKGKAQVPKGIVLTPRQLQVLALV